MALLAGCFPIIPALLAMQAAGLAAGVFPLWGIARRHAGLGTAGSALCLGLYALHPALHNAALFDFHPEFLVVPLLLGAVLLALDGRWVPYAACVAVALLCREDVAIPVVSLGVVVVISGHPRAGACTAGAGAAWFVIATRVVQPHFAGEFLPAEFLAAYGDSVGEIVGTLLTDPVRVLDDLLTHQAGAFAWAMLSPLALLPLLAPRWLLPGVPLAALYLLSSRTTAHDVQHHYVVVPIVFTFAALPFGLARARRALAAARIDRASALVVCAALLLGTAVHELQTYGRDALAREPRRWFVHDAYTHARLRAAAMVPADAAVSATVRMWPLLAERRSLYGFPAPWRAYDARRDPVPLDERRGEVRWFVLDTADRTQWHAGLAADLDRLRACLQLETVFAERGILVLRRPAGPPGARDRCADEVLEHRPHDP